MCLVVWNSFLGTGRDATRLTVSSLLATEREREKEREIEMVSSNLVLSSIVLSIISISFSSSFARMIPSEDGMTSSGGVEDSCASTLSDRSKINDNYCDCESDGSDETKTSACTYYVKLNGNKKKIAKFECKDGTRIHLSRVDDAICDCCDGQDESFVRCEDRCESMLADKEERSRRRNETLRLGSEQKKKMIEKAGLIMKEKNVESRQATSLLNRLIEYRDRDLGPRHRIESAIERHEQGVCAYKFRTNHTCDLELDEIRCPNSWSRETFSRTRTIKKKKKKKTIKESFFSLWNVLTSYDYELRTREHTERLDMKQWDDVIERDVSPEHVIDRVKDIHFRVPISQDTCQNITISSLLLTNTSFSSLRTSTNTSSMGATYPWRAGPRYCDSYTIRTLQRVISIVIIAPYRFFRNLITSPKTLWHEPLSLFQTPCDIYIVGDLSRPLMRPEAAALRVAMSALDHAIKSTKSKLENLESNQGKSLYGNFLEFYPLHGSCFEHESGEYTYSLCPFENVTQRKTSSGGSVTKLGLFSKWNVDVKNNNNNDDLLYPDTMRFVNGTKIWKKGKRNTTVFMRCGTENVLVGVDEPSIGEYTMTMETPAACPSWSITKKKYIL